VKSIHKCAVQASLFSYPFPDVEKSRLARSFDLEASEISAANGDGWGALIGYTTGSRRRQHVRTEQIRLDLDLFSENTTFFAGLLIGRVAD